MNNFKITKREVLVSVSIIAILLLIGILISNKISDYVLDQNEKYNKAIKIETLDLFEYGMRTDVGNAFVYGDLKAVDTVTYPELPDSYMYVEKIKERYMQHTRQVAHTRTVNGKTQTYYTTETYWSWDRVGSEDKKCNEVSFLGYVMPSYKIDIPSSSHIDTIKESNYIRYKYYGTGLEFTGTIFTRLSDGTISDDTPFYNNMSIAETADYLKMGIPIYIFWVAWLIFIVFVVYGFYYVDNRWLE